ncbi:MAG TPA: hypothetical protein VG056_13685 [Pirellulales bacterium]|jgi:hypothetical protein|nr:hypothetical protein [Pirellulales bacterium]
MTESEKRLFACGCCRRIWDLLLDERLRRGIEIRERYERGLALEDEVKAAIHDCYSARAEIRAPLKSGLVNFSENSPEAAPGWAAAAAYNATRGTFSVVPEFVAKARACAAVGDNWNLSFEKEMIAQRGKDFRA